MAQSLQESWGRLPLRETEGRASLRDGEGASPLCCWKTLERCVEACEALVSQVAELHQQTVRGLNSLVVAPTPEEAE